jgi:TonB family protein
MSGATTMPRATPVPRLGLALLAALLLHGAMLLGLADDADGSSAMPGRGDGAGQARTTAIEVWLQAAPAPAAVAAALTEPVAAPPPMTPRPVTAPPAPVAPSAAASTAQASGGGGRGGYLAKVRARIEQQRRSLSVSARGTAQVAFTVAVDGSVSELMLERSAGDAVLDQEALALVQRAAPMPLPPQRNALRLSVPVLFE